MATERGISVDVCSRTVQRHMNEEGIFKFKDAKASPSILLQLENESKCGENAL
jgi:hypothetical protein